MFALFLSCGKAPSDEFQAYELNVLRDNPKPLQYRTDNEEIVQGLPAFGKWMFDHDYTPSKWSDEEINDKHIREPINIIIADSISQTENEAEQNLMNALEQAGYENRWGHSSGYKGLIDNIYCKQFPGDDFRAISNGSFAFDNNHGRIFGPYHKNGVYYFTAAMSRESGYYHEYISFVQARDDFALSLNTHSNYKHTKKIWLHNFLNTDSETTGDHDGYAIFIEATDLSISGK